MMEESKKDDPTYAGAGGGKSQVSSRQSDAATEAKEIETRRREALDIAPSVSGAVGASGDASPVSEGAAGDVEDDTPVRSPRMTVATLLCLVRLLASVDSLNDIKECMFELSSSLSDLAIGNGLKEQLTTLNYLILHKIINVHYKPKLLSEAPFTRMVIYLDLVGRAYDALQRLRTDAFGFKHIFAEAREYYKRGRTIDYQAEEALLLSYQKLLSEYLVTAVLEMASPTQKEQIQTATEQSDMEGYVSTVLSQAGLSAFLNADRCRALAAAITKQPLRDGVRTLDDAEMLRAIVCTLIDLQHASRDDKKQINISELLGEVSFMLKAAQQGNGVDCNRLNACIKGILKAIPAVKKEYEIATRAEREAQKRRAKIRHKEEERLLAEVMYDVRNCNRRELLPQYKQRYLKVVAQLSAYGIAENPATSKNAAWVANALASLTLMKKGSVEYNEQQQFLNVGILPFVKDMLSYLEQLDEISGDERQRYIMLLDTLKKLKHGTMDLDKVEWPVLFDDICRLVDRPFSTEFLKALSHTLATLQSKATEAQSGLGMPVMTDVVLTDGAVKQGAFQQTLKSTLKRVGRAAAQLRAEKCALDREQAEQDHPTIVDQVRNQQSAINAYKRNAKQAKNLSKILKGVEKATQYYNDLIALREALKAALAAQEKACRNLLENLTKQHGDHAKHFDDYVIAARNSTAALRAMQGLPELPKPLTDELHEQWKDATTEAQLQAKAASDATNGQLTIAHAQELKKLDRELLHAENCLRDSATLESLSESLKAHFVVIKKISDKIPSPDSAISRPLAARAEAVNAQIDFIVALHAVPLDLSDVEFRRDVCLEEAQMLGDGDLERIRALLEKQLKHVLGHYDIAEDSDSDAVETFLSLSEAIDGLPSDEQERQIYAAFIDNDSLLAGETPRLAALVRGQQARARDIVRGASRDRVSFSENAAAATTGAGEVASLEPVYGGVRARAASESARSNASRVAGPRRHSGGVFTKSSHAAGMSSADDKAVPGSPCAGAGAAGNGSYKGKSKGIDESMFPPGWGI